MSKLLSHLAVLLVLTLPLQVLAEGQQERNQSTGESSGSLGDLFSSGTKTKVTSGQDSPTIDEVQREAYNGPKARIAIARFTDKTGSGWYTGRIGDGMADQLATALFHSNRYIVLERQNLDAVLTEQDLGASGRIKQETAAPIGEIEGAELLVTGAVTEFEGNASGAQGGVGGGAFGGFGGILGAITGGYNKAHMAIDVRVIDTKTSRIVAATSVEGEATDVNLGGAVGSYFGGGALGGALAGWKNTPTEKALRICIQRAVDFIASKTPAVYYRYGSGAAQQAAATPTQAQPKAQPQTQARAESPTFDAGAIVRVKSNRLNMRAGPSTGNPVVASLALNDPLRVVGQSGNWVQVTTVTGVSGWVAAWLVYPDNTLSAEGFANMMQANSTATQSGTTATTMQPAASKPVPEARGSGPAGGGDKMTDIKTKLKQAKELYDAELISEEEYKAIRAQILSAL